MQRFDRVDLAIVILFGAAIVSDLLWTRRKLRPFAASEPARKNAVQFLWSCIFFSMLTLGLGMAVSGFVWSSADFLRRFSLIFWSVITCVAIYPVLRDAKRLADTAGPSTSFPGDDGRK
jgi:hypothetical protein